MSEKQVHYLKTWPEYFGVILSGAKRFEIRKNDRGFSVGDELVLQEFTSQGGFTGREIDARITYLTDFEQKPGFVVLGIATRAPSPALDRLKEEIGGAITELQILRSITSEAGLRLRVQPFLTRALRSIEELYEN